MGDVPHSRVLFLDVDGVLNNSVTFRSIDSIDHDSWRRCLSLVERTDTQIVLSSTWRLCHHTHRCYRRLVDIGLFNYTHEDWRTPSTHVDPFGERHYYPSRGDEIAAWLARHPEVTSWAIVDDDSDMLPEQLERFVQTGFDSGGLLDHHCDALERILTEGSDG
jgi:hypothetical protein